MKTKTKTLIGVVICFLLLNATFLTAQNISKNLPEFDKVVVSPGINLTLKKGDKEHLEVIGQQSYLEQLNIEVKNGKLLIYFNKAKYWIKDKAVFVGGHNVKVDAYLSYKTLKTLKVKGDQDVVCENKIENKDVKIVVYGDAFVKIDEIVANKLKVKLYGDNQLMIGKGKVKYQKCKVYGDNKLFARNVISENIKSVSMGDSRNEFHCNGYLKVTSFGDSDISVNGDGAVKRKLVLGDNRISHFHY